MTARGLRSLSRSCDAGISTHDLTVDVILGSHKPFLNAFNRFLSLQLVLQILLKNEFSVTLTIQFEVGGSLDEVLIDEPKLASHVALLVRDVEHVLGLPVCLPTVLWGSHERCGLTWITITSCKRVPHIEVVEEVTRDG